MNCKWILLMAAIMVTTAAGAQKINLGIKAGINMSANSGNGMNSSLQQGIDVGAFSEIALGKKWSVNPELYFSHRSTERADNFMTYYVNEGVASSDKDIKLSYISVPVLLSYKLSSVISFQAGPQFNWLVFEDDNLLKNGRDAFTKTDLGVAAGVTLTLEKFRIYGRYTQGFSDVNGIDGRHDWKSRQLQLGAALSLFNWK
ncbi:porin family protein [Filimonas effusa]|uniref:PorT family protein n=1 Tax=Filimonas effusa TaxID=2508721 RepID=A0A4Q1D5C2_9BACT|nr:porin family protein [Filimonas effusa]RXK83568.1 PorT family protein [Filimonas effusa]